MEWKDVLAQLVEFVETAAPTVWMLARRQVIVDAVQMALWAIGLTWYVRWGIVKTKQCKDIDDFYDDPFGLFVIVAVIGAYVSIPVAIGLLVGIISRLINPDFYAIRLLLSFGQR